MAYPEGEVGETLGQTRQRLEAGSCFGDQGKRRGRAGKVSAGVLDTLCLTRFILEGS